MEEVGNGWKEDGGSSEIIKLEWFNDNETGICELKLC